MSDAPVAEGNKTFKSVLNMVAFFTFLCFCTYAVLAIFGSGTDSQENLSGMCDFGFKAGFGAILGLLGGKSP